jgi:hypothetical protein
LPTRRRLLGSMGRPVCIGCLWRGRNFTTPLPLPRICRASSSPVPPRVARSEWVDPALACFVPPPRLLRKDSAAAVLVRSEVSTSAKLYRWYFLLS